MVHPGTGRRRLSLPLLALLPTLAAVACGELRPATRPALVIGVDGAEWRVIRRLRARGELPHLERLAERGAAAHLTTGYHSFSPVVWTTIVTGVTPQRHGIDNFVVSSDAGPDLPVSSTVRRAPALWEMLTEANRTVSVFGWWASWPADEVNGVMVTDRALEGLADVVSPATRRPWFDSVVADASRRANPFPPNLSRDQDHLVAIAAERLLREERAPDLLLVYLRSIDIVSHLYWKHFLPDPERFPVDDPQEMATYGEYVPRAYGAVDQVVGRLVELAGPEANVFVLSDHGFWGARKEEIRISIDLDKVLEALGFLHYAGDRVDRDRSRIYTLRSSSLRARKLVRLSPDADGDPAALRHQLERRLEAVRYETGAPVFAIHKPDEDELQAGTDLVVSIRRGEATGRLLLDATPIEGAVAGFARFSGAHGSTTRGIFIAAGPDIQPAAEIEGIDIHDITPTLLYGLDLPIAADFDGRAWRRLYTPEIRATRPLRQIASWGSRETSGPRASKVDPKLRRQLRALGYLD